MQRSKITFVLFFLLALKAAGQEISCKVSVNFSQLATNTQQNDRQYFADMEQAVFNFMNNQKWTTDVFGEQEKIKCNLVINLLRSPAQNSFSGNAQFQVLRPVYGTTYETIVFQYVDRAFDFSFAPEDRQMLFNEQSFSGNLTSILGFYSLIALSMDYDSYSKLGGSQYIERAFNISNLAGNAVGGAWSANSDMRNRYWLVENLRSQQLMRFREGMYTYHRLVLDDLATNPAAGRGQVLDFLRAMKNMVSLKSNAIIINTFLDAKTQELVNIFSEGTTQEKQQAFALLTNLNPDKSEIYRQIQK